MWHHRKWHLTKLGHLMETESTEEASEHNLGCRPDEHRTFIAPDCPNSQPHRAAFTPIPTDHKSNLILQESLDSFKVYIVFWVSVSIRSVINILPSQKRKAYTKAVTTCPEITMEVVRVKWDGADLDLSNW